MKRRLLLVLLAVLAVPLAGYVGFSGASLLFAGNAKAAGEVGVPSPDALAEATVAATRDLFRTADAKAEIPDELLATMAGELTSHWYGRIANTGNFAIQYNPVADMFLVISMDPEAGTVTRSAWLAGEKLVGILRLQSAPDLTFIQRVLGERAIQLHAIVDAVELGADVWPALDDSLTSRFVAEEAVGNVLRYLALRETSKDRACHQEIEDYVARLDVRTLGAAGGIVPEHFATRKVILHAGGIEPSRDGFFVADGVSGRQILVFSVTDPKTCEFEFKRTIGVI